VGEVNAIKAEARRNLSDLTGEGVFFRMIGLQGVAFYRDCRTTTMVMLFT
jgi:hypothetical protein